MKEVHMWGIRLAEGAATSSEREAAIRKLWKLGYFLDRINIIWDKDAVPEFAEDDLHKSLLKDDGA